MASDSEAWHVAPYFVVRGSVLPCVSVPPTMAIVFPYNTAGIVLSQKGAAMAGEIHMPIGVIGLGLMGTAITARLLVHGFPVLVWNRSREKADSLIQQGAQWSDNPLVECDRVIVSLFTSGIVAEVIEQLARGLKPGQIIIDTTTGEPNEVVSLAHNLASRGVHYLDAPISGSSEQTRRGEATVMVGGELTTVQACADLWPMLGGQMHHCGPNGSASKMKLVTNLVLGLNRAALAEGLAFASAIGVEPSAALQVLRTSAAQSRVMDVKGRKMVEADFSVQARLAQHRKDVEIILREGAAAGLPLPLSELHVQLLQQAEAEGLGALDNSAIAQIWRKTSP